MLPFHRGFEQIVKRCPAPIIPVCLDQVWGSIFSYRGGKVIWKWPQELPYPVSISFGAPMPPTTTAAEARVNIQKMSADGALARSAERLPVHRQFVRMAARYPFKLCFIDTMQNGLVLSQAKVLAQRRPQPAGQAHRAGEDFGLAQDQPVLHRVDEAEFEWIAS